MAVCVHCSTPTKELFISYGPDHLISTRCVVCNLFADPYVEQEGIIVAIDLVSVMQGHTTSIGKDLQLKNFYSFEDTCQTKSIQASTIQ
jgi:hypothetical protein